VQTNVNVEENEIAESNRQHEDAENLVEIAFQIQSAIKFLSRSPLELDIGSQLHW